MLLLALSLLVIGVAPPPAEAKRGLQIGFLDSLYEVDGQSDKWLNQTAGIGANLIRVNVRWAGVVEGEPANPTDPRDPAYFFSGIDRAVRGARQRGLQVLLVVYQAPPWAEGNGKPGGHPWPGTWKPRPNRLAEFARALGRRYSGTFNPLDGGGVLPAAQYVAPWIEPNIGVYLTPQKQGGKKFAPGHYRKMQNAFYNGVKATNPRIHVMTAGTAPFGDPRGGNRTSPLIFWRDVLCLRRNLKKKRNCPPGPERARFDSLAHHPLGINSRGRPTPPRRKGRHPEDLVIANFGKLRKTLRAAEKQGTTGTKGRHGLWVPEVWWQSKPRKEGVSLQKQARFMAEGLFLLWKAGATGVTFLQLVDSQHNPDQGSFTNYLTGVFKSNGKRKPSYQAVRFPFVTERRGGKKVFAWGRSPRSGRVLIQRQKGKRWKRLAAKRVSAGDVFTAKVRLPKGSKQKLRAKVGTDTSRVWVQKG